MKTRRRDRWERGQAHSSIDGGEEAKYMDVDAVV